jgi:hypothetical protein
MNPEQPLFGEYGFTEAGSDGGVALIIDNFPVGV